MEPNESTRGRSGQSVSFSGDYRAVCCAAVKHLTSGESFPNCSEHGETEWSWIPPFVQSDFGTAALIAHWKHLQSQKSHAVMSQGLALGPAVFESVGVDESVSPSVGTLSLQTFNSEVQIYPEILLQAAIIDLGDKISEGQIIEAVEPAWLEIIKQIDHDPMFLYKFSEYDRKFEELIAAAYKRAGWPEVILTPRSGDKGKDVIASKPGYCAIRIVDQAKAYSPNHRVTAKDVDALLGALTREPNISKGIVTTTSQFAPGIEKDESIKKFMPYRLELRNGKQFCEWLSVLYKLNS
jgi:restriction system protein